MRVRASAPGTVKNGIQRKKKKNKYLTNGKCMANFQPLSVQFAGSIHSCWASYIISLIYLSTNINVRSSGDGFSACCRFHTFSHVVTVQSHPMFINLVTFHCTNIHCNCMRGNLMKTKSFAIERESESRNWMNKSKSQMFGIYAVAAEAHELSRKQDRETAAPENLITWTHSTPKWAILSA